MNDFSLFVFLVSLICLIIGRFKPEMFRKIFKNKSTRKTTSLAFGSLSIFSFIIFSITIPSEGTSTLINLDKDTENKEMLQPKKLTIEDSISKSNRNVGNRSLSYYQGILEKSPFDLVFYDRPSRVNDTNFYTRGYSADKSTSATIHFDPRDEAFCRIEFLIRNLSLNPKRSDFKILLVFNNLFDSQFSNYFDRNFDGVVKDEDAFVDNRRYMNKAEGFIFEIDGDVAYNNMSIKEHPEQKKQIINAGNFVTVNVINARKTSWLFNESDTLNTVNQ